MTDYLVDMFLAIAAGLNAWYFAADGHPLSLGVAVACGVAALVRRPSKR